MTQSFALAITLCLGLLARAALADPVVSAARAPDESFEAASARALQALQAEGGAAFTGLTAWSAATETQGETPGILHGSSASLPEWPSIAVTQQKFREVRDERFLSNPNSSRFLRRPPWLYPDDGCFARAQSVVEQLEGSGLPAPAKLFIFGDLSLRTPYSSSGAVYWWYHVVPAVSVDGTTMILDPSVDAKRALPIQEWISRMTRDPSQIRISVCDSQSYNPYSPCHGGSEAVAHANAVQDLPVFLSYEWNRMWEVGLNPNRVLGDAPPWLGLEAFNIETRL